MGTGAKTLHNKMLGNILRSPLSFFDTTPQGRILNRFGKDVDVLDTTMPMIFRGWITCLLEVVATFVIISYSTPIFMAPVFVVMGFYYFVQKNLCCYFKTIKAFRVRFEVSNFLTFWRNPQRCRHYKSFSSA